MSSSVPNLTLTETQVLQILSLPEVREHLGMSISQQATVIPISARRDTYRVQDTNEQYIVRFRLSLVSEPMLEQVLVAYQELDPTRSIDRDRIAIYYRAFLFHLMVGKVGERLDHLQRLLRKHIAYYDATRGGLGTCNAEMS